MNRKAVDLNAFAKALRSAGTHRRLEATLRRLHGRGVVRADLDTASRSIKQLIQMLDRPGGALAFNDTELIIGEALLTQSIVAYCRALVSEGEGRSKSGADAKFTSELRAAHLRISGLRNRRLCHYGVSSDPDEMSWSDDRAVLAVEGETCRINFVVSRVGWRTEIVRDVEMVCSAAATINNELLRVAADDLFAEFQRVMPDIGLLDLMNLCPFDPYAFFHDPAQAALTYEDGDAHDVRMNFFKPGT
ncbi:MAG: hypothetical protein ACYDD1_16990 [Caulobacteraceae bacterium]